MSGRHDRQRLGLAPLHKQQQQAFLMAGPGPFIVRHHLHASRRASCPARRRPSYSASRLRNWRSSAAVTDAALGQLFHLVLLGTFIFHASRAIRIAPVLVHARAHITHSYTAARQSWLHLAGLPPIIYNSLIVHEKKWKKIVYWKSSTSQFHQVVSRSFSRQKTQNLTIKLFCHVLSIIALPKL